jgi:endonuclease/exonuclease/phosphatase family metal-dependent hydrolase
MELGGYNKEFDNSPLKSKAEESMDKVQDALVFAYGIPHTKNKESLANGAGDKLRSAIETAKADIVAYKETLSDESWMQEEVKRMDEELEFLDTELKDLENLS